MLFANWLTYTLCLLLCISWAAVIPYTRYALGVHSLDQIVYGSSLGLWAGVFMHLYVRDNFIRYIEKVILS